MSYEFYKVLHLAGIFMVMTAIGAHLSNGLAGGEKTFPGKKFAGMLHGIGLLVAFVAGFGLMAKIGLQGTGWPMWTYVKIGIWVVFGLATLLPKKFPQYSKLIWIGLLALGVFATYLARYKPF